MPDAATVGSARRQELARAFCFVNALLLGLFVAVRVGGAQLELFAPDAAMAALLALAWAATAWGGAAVDLRRPALPDGLSLALCLWLGLNVLALLRAPHAGAGVPLGLNALLFALLLYGGFCAGSAFPGSLRHAAAALIGLGAIEAAYGLWLRFVQLPRLRAAAAGGTLALPDELTSQLGLERLASGEIFGTFEIANSYAAFLVLSMLLQAGWWSGRLARLWAAGGRPEGLDAAHGLLFAVQAAALYCSGSTGGWVALAAGLWFCFIQLANVAPRTRKLLGIATAFGLSLLVLALVLLGLGVVSRQTFGISMAVRLEYWRTGWAMLTQSGDTLLLGTGLGGFTEHFPLFKTAMATEAREAHNDWLQLAVELGVLGPVAWAALWFCVLRPLPAADSTVPGQPVSTDEPLLRRSRMALLAGALLGLALLLFVLGAFSGPDLLAFVSGDTTAETMRGALFTVLMPVLLAGAVLLLYRSKAAAGATEPTSAGLLAGIRAAVGAILIHQLVDFDLRVPALWSALALLGGLLAAERVRRAPAPASALARIGHYALPLGLLAALPVTFGPLLNSGSARQSASIDAEERREVLTRTPASPDQAKLLGQQAEALLESEVRNREAAFRWAPFDGDAAFALALAYLELGRARARWAPHPHERDDRPVAELAAERLDDARRLRPHWPGAAAMAGHHALQTGVQLLKSPDAARAAAFFERAEWHYREAARLYPHAPGLRMLAGDALLFQGRVEDAGEAYAQAWDADRLIFDPNVRFSAIFHDPRPGCLARHELELEVLALAVRALDARPQDAARLRLGLALRRVIGLAWMRSRALAQQLAAVPVKELDATQVRACDALFALAPQDGHAALFAAAALYRMDRAAGAAAWAKAEEILDAQRARGEPATPPGAVSHLRWAMELKN